MTTFQDKVKALRAHYEELLSRKNEPVEWGNGIYESIRTQSSPQNIHHWSGVTTSMRRAIRISCSAS